jgi:AcrR family transcriptional regulator
MPKAFTAREKEVIRQQIRDKATALFEAHGLRKTTVDEITEAVGISKGAFYLFYPSKEELCLDILERIEAELRASILDQAIQPKERARPRVRRMLQQVLLTWDAYPLLKNFSQADYDYLARKLPPERVKAHVSQDNAFIDAVTSKLEREGIAIKASPRVVTNLIRMLFWASLHRSDLGEADYEQTMDVLIGLVSGYILEGTV